MVGMLVFSRALLWISFGLIELESLSVMKSEYNGAMNWKKSLKRRRRRQPERKREWKRGELAAYIAWYHGRCCRDLKESRFKKNQNWKLPLILKSRSLMKESVSKYIRGNCQKLPISYFQGIQAYITEVIVAILDLNK